jgi:hypothetical protein
MKKGISALTITIILIFLITSTLLILWIGIKPHIEKGLKDKCYQDYAGTFCLKNNLTLYSSDREAGYFTCWTNKEKGEKKRFYIIEEKCK